MLIPWHDFLGRMKWMLIPSATSNSPMEGWEYFLQRYIQTSVTVADDCVAAFAGITDAFASKPQFKGVVCHSGVWNFRGWTRALCW